MNVPPFFCLAGNFQYRSPTLVPYKNAELQVSSCWSGEKFFIVVNMIFRGFPGGKFRNFFNLLSIVYSSAEFYFSQSLIVLLVFLGEILEMLSYKLQKEVSLQKF